MGVLCPRTVASDPANFLATKGISKSFGEFTALKSIDISIPRGEFVCFLGPSGCGKTTLLRIIAGLERQCSGRIFLGDVDVSDAQPSERDFGIVFQSYALFPNLTAVENVAYGLECDRKTKSEARSRARELLALVGLTEHGDKYPTQMSGGQQQRVAIARALAKSPSLLLLDEPLSALDARVRQHLRAELRQLHRRLGVTTIMVTHDQEEALTLSDRIVVMNNGVIEQVGTPQEIYHQPATEFVANFVGAMSVLSAHKVDSHHVRIGAAVLRCNGCESASVGQAVTVGIRPEDVRVREVRLEDENALVVRVEQMDFMGPFCRATLSPDGADQTIEADLSANLLRDLSVVVGQSISVALPAHLLRVFAVGGKQ